MAALDGTQGNAYLREHVDIVRSVFEQAGHQNLRLLRNALRECSLVLDRIDEQLFAAREPMARFVRTYIALAMALARGEIAPDDLDQRDNARIGISGEVEDGLKGLNNVLKRHNGADIFAHSGTVLPQGLCELLFVGGYADTATLNALLKSTNQLEPQDENPLWRRIYDWGDLGWDEICDLVAEGEKYLFETNPVEAGPYLHIAAGMLHVAEHGGLEVTWQNLKSRILGRVAILAATGGLPSAELGLRLGWGKRGGTSRLVGTAMMLTTIF